jgi:phosphoglycolate phosphatase
VSQPIRAVFFDLDGTLLDTKTGIVEAFRRACQDLKLSPLPPADAIAREIGPPIGEMAKALGLPLPPEAVDELVARYRAHYETMGPEHSPPFPGIPEVLEGLEKLREAIPGFVLGVATNKLTPVAERVLDDVGLKAFFDVIQGVDPDLRPKPAPDILTRALQRGGAQAETSIFIGDTRGDLLTARAVGTRSGLAAYGYGAEAVPPTLVPDLRIERPQELLVYLHQTLAGCGEALS